MSQHSRARRDTLISQGARQHRRRVGDAVREYIWRGAAVPWCDLRNPAEPAEVESHRPSAGRVRDRKDGPGDSITWRNSLQQHLGKIFHKKVIKARISAIPIPTITGANDICLRNAQAIDK